MKIAVLGCDGSHSIEYARRLIKHQSVNKIVFWDQDPRHAHDKKLQLPSSSTTDSLQDAIDGAAICLVTGRYASSHDLPAEAALSAPVFTYVDKPGFSTPEVAERLFALSKSNDVMLTGFSPFVCSKDFQKFKLTYQNADHFTVACPAFCYSINETGANDISFYASHACDLLCHLVDSQIVDARTTELRNGIAASVTFKTKQSATLYLPFVQEEFYHVTASSGAETSTLKIDPWGDSFDATTDYILGSVSSKLHNYSINYPATIESLRLVQIIKQQAGDNAWKK
jgi:hypothetical protein